MIAPKLSKIASAAQALRGSVLQTPVLPLSASRWDTVLPNCASAHLKLELFQQAGSFKARGALLGIQRLSDDERTAGVVAASGGNHALAISWAAKEAGVSALIMMPRSTDPVRIEGCEALGARVDLHDDMAAAFAAMNVASEQGRQLMHPFEAEHMVLGSATCGQEYLAQVPEADIFVVPIGGGGLISGMAVSIKQIKPSAVVIGVEPVGADSMSRSFQANAPIELDKVETIADSLGSPLAMPYTFGLARTYVDRIVQITDHQMLEAMDIYQNNLRITAEPACAASLAAILGPLRDDLAGRHVAIIACGSNISLSRYQALMTQL